MAYLEDALPTVALEGCGCGVWIRLYFAIETALPVAKGNATLFPFDVFLFTDFVSAEVDKDNKKRCRFLPESCVLVGCFHSPQCCFSLGRFLVIYRLV